MSHLIPILDKFNPIFGQFVKDYDVHFCRLDEIDDVVTFLDTYWKKGHVLVKSRLLMDWQHRDEKNNRYNFVLARTKNTYEIHALLGFIPNSFFDPFIERVLLWGAIWKVRNDVAPTGLGIYLFQYLTNSIPAETWVSFGINEEAKINNKMMGFKIFSTENYFFANPVIRNFKIAAGIERFQNPQYCDQKDCVLAELSISDYEKISDKSKIFDFAKPYKSKMYYLNRYFKHPYYKYRCFSIKQNDSVKSIFFVRESPTNCANCLRLVEYVGDYADLSYVKGSINKLLADGDFEYIDIVTSIADEAVLEPTGFINKKNDSNIIIPNYFEPFVQKNVPMKYSFITLNIDYKCVINKGDADQDRPSVLT